MVSSRLSSIAERKANKKKNLIQKSKSSSVLNTLPQYA